MLSIARFYCFTDFADFAEWQMPLKAFGQARGILGTVLIATEGMNGTLAGTHDALEEFFAHIKKDTRFARLNPKYNHYSAEETAGWLARPHLKN